MNTEEKYNLDCKTVCDGKKFWTFDNADKKSHITPRKCTQSIIQFCSIVNSKATPASLAPPVSPASPTFVRKVFHNKDVFKQEMKILDYLQNIDGFPKVQSTNIQKKEMIFSYAGDPVQSKTIPKDCYEQISNLCQSLNKIGIRHNDLVPHNFLNNLGKISLIDFGRSTITLNKVSQRELEIQTMEFKSIASILCNSEKLDEYQKRQLKPKYTTAVSRFSSSKE
jgi:tRNA A-37 threonylcarbamoyl transferase component Bud32